MLTFYSEVRQQGQIMLIIYMYVLMNLYCLQRPTHKILAKTIGEFIDLKTLVLIQNEYVFKSSLK